jgi:hypothetical protein
MKIVCKKNHYQNRNGQKKVKIMTRGKSYDVLLSGLLNNSEVWILNDLNKNMKFLWSDFTNLEKSRDIKINDLLN